MVNAKHKSTDAGDMKANDSCLPLSACRFSVLICTYNRPELLAQCLEALVCHTTEKPDQIVIVNGGDERADEVVKSVTRKRAAVGIEITLVRTINQNLATSRNVGLPYCTGDIVAMTDDDAEVFPDWVTQLKRLHAAHKEAGVIGGRVVGASADSLISRLADVVTFSSPAAAGYVRTLPGVNVSYKRKVVDAIGPQDEKLFRGEDVDYNWRAKLLGYQVYYDPSVRVLHHHRPTLRKFLYQHYMYGRAYFLVRQKWPAIYCVYPHCLRAMKDLIRAANFFVASLYEPLLVIPKLNRVTDWFVAYPILFANQLAWRAGMVREMLTVARGEKRTNSKELTAKSHAAVEKDRAAVGSMLRS